MVDIYVIYLLTQHPKRVARRHFAACWWVDGLRNNLLSWGL